MAKVTLEDILHTIRDRIAYASDHDERRLLSEITTAFSVTEEASYGTDSKDILLIMGELEGWARDAVMGMRVTAYLPRHEKISNVFKQVAESANSRINETKANHVKILDLEHILHTLRDQIEKALASDERRLLEQMATTLTIIREAVDKIEDKKTSFIIRTLWYIAREGYLGFKVQYELPSHEKIAEAFE